MPSPPPYSLNRWRSSSVDCFGRANPTTPQHQQRLQPLHSQQVYFHTPPCGHHSTSDPLHSLDQIHFRDIGNCFWPEIIVKLSTTFIQTAPCHWQEMTALGSHSIPTGERDSESPDHKHFPGLAQPSAVSPRSAACSLAHGHLLSAFAFSQPSCKPPS